MDLDRPESPPQAEDLEVLNVLGSATDLDASDFPERPATPEPKDDSSDGQAQEDYGDEDEDEDDDISVAIAKAKAAILKKQRELAKKAISDDNKMSEDGLDKSPMSLTNAAEEITGDGDRDMAVE